MSQTFVANSTCENMRPRTLCTCTGKRGHQPLPPGTHRASHSGHRATAAWFSDTKRTSESTSCTSDLIWSRAVEQNTKMYLRKQGTETLMKEQAEKSQQRKELTSNCARRASSRGRSMTPASRSPGTLAKNSPCLSLDLQPSERSVGNSRCRARGVS